MTRLASDAAIREKGLKVLYKHLGETDAVRFLSQVSIEKKDYLKVQQKLFQGMSVDELYDQAAASCAEDSAEYKGKR
ncbi:MAG: hypothetical protein JJE30_18680 [Desulfuromonadales bacterium]|nr:hypothetical protein [Desulfuromonadales bacterium]